MADLSNNEKNTTGIENISTGDNWNIDANGRGDTNSIITDSGGNELNVQPDGSINVNAVLGTPERYVYEKRHLFNGGSKNLNVNGAGTPVTFELTETGTIFVTRITVFLFDPGTMDLGDFGSIGGGLATGLDINITADSTTYLLANIETNEELIREFSRDQVAGGDIYNSGFMTEDDWFTGSMDFSERPIELRYGSGDEIVAVVNDNLLGLTNLGIAITYFRKI